MRKWFARLFALIALGAAGFGIYYAIDSVKDDDKEVTAAQARDAVAQITEANADLSSKLRALKVHTSPQLAQESVRSAAALTRDLDEKVGDKGDLAEAVHTIIRKELAYLDAVGSTLANPRSPLRSQVAEFALAVRKALREVPGTGSAEISGVAKLIAFSEARLG